VVAVVVTALSPHRSRCAFDCSVYVASGVLRAWAQDDRAYLGHKEIRRKGSGFTLSEPMAVTRRLTEEDMAALQNTALMLDGLCALLDDLAEDGSAHTADNARSHAAQLRRLRERLWPRDLFLAGYGADREWYAALRWLFAQGMPYESVRSQAQRRSAPVREGP
jgi:hypothetical protein